MAQPRPGTRSRHWGVERRDVSFPFRVDDDDPRVGRSASAETWRAAAALAAGVSLAVLSYVQFRGMRGDAIAVVAAVAEATTEATTESSVPEPSVEIPAAVTEAVLQVSPRRSPAGPSRKDSSEPAAPVRRTPTKLAAGVVHEMRPPEAPSATPAVDPAEPRPVPAEPAPAPADAKPRLALLEAGGERNAAAALAPIVAVPVDPVRGDEDRIRAALASWRTAYSQLDARAAREIWPSVDARALERAFRALKSQDVRFDRCDLTVAGGRARAACVGRAVYVPRVGNQSPRASAREWTFELKKLDEQWTIASARAS